METAGGSNIINAVCITTVKDNSEVRYAKGFADIMGVPLVVYPHSARLSRLARSKELQAIQRERVKDIFPQARVIDSLSDQPGLAVVGNSVARNGIDNHGEGGSIFLAPHREENFDPHGKRQILVPFGNGKSSDVALVLAISIAKKTLSKIFLYHTTRPNESMSPGNWREHMVPGAVQALERAVAMCRANGVEFSVETTSVYPRQIAEGIADAAYDHDCNLIAMAVAEDVDFGSHCSQVLDYSLVPTIVVVERR